MNANLRGFYFTSGTQAGTPIDMVLGEMERSFGGVAAGGMMSGKGKSFFLHDLLRKVIFAEAGWVSTDRHAVRRKALLRTAAFTSIAIVTFGMIGLWDPLVPAEPRACANRPSRHCQTMRSTPRTSCAEPS